MSTTGQARSGSNQPQEKPKRQASGNTSNRGFASMDQDQQRKIASMGGKAAHEKGTAHEFTSEEARAAGSKGGQAAHERGTAHVFSSEEARAAGSKGGQVSQVSQGKANSKDGQGAQKRHH